MEYLTYFWTFIKDPNHWPLLASILVILSIFLKIPQRIIQMFAEYKFNKMLNKILQKMDEERNKPNFINGSLDAILEIHFKKISKKLKDRCIKKLEEDHEIEIGPFGNYVFFRGKIPELKYRNFNPYGKG